MGGGYTSWYQNTERIKKNKTNFILSLFPKSAVVAVMERLSSAVILVGDIDLKSNQLL